MSNSVVIKGNKHGIMVVLDESLAFEELKQQIREKFISSAKFFGDADMALAFEGRKLSIDEEKEIVDIITEVSELNILCILDSDKEDDLIFEAAVQNALKKMESQSKEEEINKEVLAKDSLKEGQFYKGTLRSGQVLEAEGSLIVLGDVNPGGRIIATGNVVILGSLRGNVFAGVNGNEDCFVVALEMNPMQIKIGSVIARSSDADNRKKKNKGLEPKIAYVEDGNIYIEDLGQEVFEDIRI